MEKTPLGDIGVHFDPEVLKIDNADLCDVLKQDLCKGQTDNLHFASATFSANKRLPGLVLSEIDVPESKQTIQSFYVLDADMHLDEKAVAKTAAPFTQIWGDDCLTCIPHDLASQKTLLQNSNSLSMVSLQKMTKTILIMKA